VRDGGADVLNIGRMTPGCHDYYLSVVARGAEDYYIRRGEAPGRWLGRGLELVGLDGEVSGEALRRVLAGDHPQRLSRSSWKLRGRSPA
jgi:hypothetical protein